MIISGKTIVITGASSGIGELLARQLSKQGAKVALLARRIDKLEKIKGEIEKYSSDIFTIKCDVRNKDEVFNSIEKITMYFSGIDIIINNAGQGYFGLIENMKIEQQRIPGEPLRDHIIRDFRLQKRCMVVMPWIMLRPMGPIVCER